MNEPKDLLQVERRIAATRAVGAVMRAVWALARAQLPATDAAAAQVHIYQAWVASLVDRVAGSPLPRPPAETLWILVGPERPFCGGLARRVVSELPPSGPVGLVGTRLIELVATRPDIQDRVVFELQAPTTVEQLGPRAHDLAVQLLATVARFDAVLVHPRGAGMDRCTLATRRAAAPDVELFASPDVVLQRALLAWVTATLSGALAETLRAEVRARLVAADSARGAAERKLDDLERQWRVLRQGEITQELLEITRPSQTS